MNRGIIGSPQNFRPILRSKPNPSKAYQVSGKEKEMQHAQEGKGKRKVFILYSFFKDKFLKSKKKKKLLRKI